MSFTVRESTATAAALRDPIPWTEFRDVVGMIEETGYRALFLPEIAGREAFSTLSALADHTQRLQLGTGVVTSVSRRVQITAMAAATVHEVSGGRLVLGLGAGPSGSGSLERLQAYVTALRALLAGERVEVEAVSGPPTSVRLTAPPATPPPIWLAALGPRAMRLAGEVADGVLLNWCPPERVAVARELVREGAERAGRDPGRITIAAYVRACVGQDDDAAFASLRAAAGEYAAIPAYRRQFELAGFATEAAAAAAAHANRRPDDVPARLVRGVTLSGDASSARAGLEQFRAAGVDLPVVYPVAARDRNSSLLGTLLALAPHPVLAPGA